MRVRSRIGRASFLLPTPSSAFRTTNDSICFTEKNEPAKERVRAARHGAWIDALARDARYGLRQIRRDPAFSAIAIATLALGIGGITAMFSAFDTVLIRPLPPLEFASPRECR